MIRGTENVIKQINIQMVLRLTVEAMMWTSFARVQCLVAPNNGTRYEEQNYTRIVFFVPVTADHSHSPALSGSATCASSCRTLIIENRGITETHSKPLHYRVCSFTFLTLQVENISGEKTAHCGQIWNSHTKCTLSTISWFNINQNK